VKVLITTFGQKDFEKVVHAMRQLPYERLVLLGKPDAIESAACARIKQLEEVSGYAVTSDSIPDGGFMDIVDEISESLERHSKDDEGRRNEVTLNISGGDKLLGDAALFAAFRLGIEAYHCDERLTKLPVLRGLTAKDRFTPSQIRFLKCIRGSSTTFDDLVDKISPGKRQPVERVMRELRKAGLIETHVQSGKIIISPSESGLEVVRAINAV